MIAHISEDGREREETVAEHTAKTEFLCRKKGARCGMTSIMSLCAVIHDMGKNKKKFDDYIHMDDKLQKNMRGSVAHASTGAKYIYDKYHNGNNSAKILTELIAYAAAAHHGIFDCVDAQKADVFFHKLENVEDYEEACQNAKRDYLREYDVDKLYKTALDEFNFIFFNIQNSVNRLQKQLIMQYRYNSDLQKEAEQLGWKIKEYSFYMISALQRLILSILIDADWEATADFMSDTDSREKRSDYDKKVIFEKASQNFALYMQRKQEANNIGNLTKKEKEIVETRNKLQRECIDFAKYPAGIYCLPIPTGGGKTLSSLAYALAYCKRHPEAERIIYVSPYISITEQNADVIRQAIGNDAWMLEHHSSVIRENTESEDYRNQKVSQFEINWEEYFICTTFVQFMNALFSDKSQSIRRMHRLIHAVVIIDEVQSMPLKCIHTFNYMINFLNQVCHTNIILCTATQPALKETKCPIEYSEPKYMIKNPEKWFAKFERVTIQTSGENHRYTFESFKEELCAQIKQYHSILVVLNTKSAVAKLYDMIKAEGVYVEYLTTNLCAEHRSDRICAIKHKLRLKKSHIIVISTNLIEAGVDISFACVYRSMAGLDSLAQTAGRCNRNGEIEQGIVHLIELEGENTGYMGELLENMRITRQTLYIYEKQNRKENLLLPKWMNLYYETLYASMSDTMNFPVKDLDTNVLQLLTRGFPLAKKNNLINSAYKTAGKMYRIIDDDSFGIIVPYKRGKKLIDTFRESSDWSEIKECIRQAQRYTVNIRGDQLKRFEGMIELVTEKIPGLYMLASPEAYHEDCGLTNEWELLII